MICFDRVPGALCAPWSLVLKDLIRRKSESESDGKERTLRRQAGFAIALSHEPVASDHVQPKPVRWPAMHPGHAHPVKDVLDMLAAGD